jgi:hypothetical protein
LEENSLFAINDIREALLDFSQAISVYSLGDDNARDVSNFKKRLHCLEEISLCRASLCVEQLRDILQNAPYLKRIYLIIAGSERLDLKSIVCCQLADIVLTSSGSDGCFALQNIATLLNAAPNVETIQLNGFDGFSLEDSLQVGETGFPNLKELKLTKTTLSTSTLKQLLLALPNLELIHLESDVSALVGVAKHTSLPFKRMILYVSSITFKELQTIIESAPHVKQIRLHAGEITSDSLDLQVNSLPQLEGFSFFSGDGHILTAHNFEQLVRAAPRLKDLYFKAIEGTLNLAKDSLTQLAQLSTLHCFLSATNAEALLNAAPNLNQESKNLLKGQIEAQNKILGGQDSKTTKLVKKAPAASTTQPNLLPAKSAHDFKSKKYFKPKFYDVNVAFNNIQTTKNQGMMIDKLSRYLTLIDSHLEMIPKIQDGICFALSCYASEITIENWRAFLINAQRWDGQFENLTASLKKQLDGLITKVKTRQFRPVTKNRAFLGDKLRDYLFSNSTTSSYILENPWHAIHIRKISDQQWCVYDPNHPLGYVYLQEEQLIAYLKQTLGNLIGVNTENASNISGNILLPLDFIEQGGLLALCQNCNMSSMIPDLNITYSKDALDGLLLRSTRGVPAWCRGLHHSDPQIQQLTQNLLRQFKDQYPDTDQKQLDKSREAMVLDPYRQDNPAPRPRKSVFANRPGRVDSAAYEKRLRTWEKQEQSVESLLQYCQNVMSSDSPKKRLIEVDSSEQLDTLRLGLEEYAKKTQRAIFYVDSPKDLVCAAAYIKRLPDGSGRVCKGPGGPLYDFLQNNNDAPATIIINYDAFSVEKKVQYHGLLDTPPQVDTIELPATIKIIGLSNSKHTNYYKGSDFYSRFDLKEDCPLTEDQWLHKTVFIEPSDGQEKTVIELFNSSDWNERLFGKWVLDGDQLQFKEGLLKDAIDQGLPIEIKHGLWNNDVFRRKLTNALPCHIKLITPNPHEPYDWKNLSAVLTHDVPEKTLLLNPTCFASFFEQFNVENGKFIKKPGLLAQARQSNPAVTIRVTRACRDDDLAMLLAECEAFDLKVHFKTEADITLPFTHSHEPIREAKTFDRKMEQDAVITSTDIDASVAMVNEAHDYHVIDISEYSSADLFIKIDGKLNQETLLFEFSEKIAAVAKLLSQKKKVILKGNFSPALCDDLTRILHERNNTSQGQLLIIKDDAISLPFNHQFVHKITIDDKKYLLKNIESIAQDTIAAEPFVRLQARLANKNNPWIGMLRTQAPAHCDLPGDFSDSSNAAKVFKQKRLEAVSSLLDQQPYVFITGLSGVGKSTFVDKVLATQPNVKMYHGESNLSAWAQDNSKQRKLLFIDEANMQMRQWSEFEGLFNKPPTIIIDGELIELSSEHKVLFAGNPMSYGDRTLASLFHNHGNAVLFEPQPPLVVYEDIIKPLCHDRDIIKPILDVYHYLCSHSKTDILITPRELQMMVLLATNFTRNHPYSNKNHVAAYYAYSVAKHLVPEEHQQEFQTQFEPKHNIFRNLPQHTAQQEYVVTTSREPVVRKLYDLLDLREFRIQGATCDAQRYGGLGGVVIEGEPGVGKSDVVLQVLIAKGYKEKKYEDTSSPSGMLSFIAQLFKNILFFSLGIFSAKTKENKIFYRLPVGMASEEKEALLLKAFHEGAVVIVDEINCWPIMQGLFNALLMGEGPMKERPLKPGFTLIGTQNSVNMAGRRSLDASFKHRMLKEDVPDYSIAEMQDILRKKGVASRRVLALVEVFQNNRTYAIQNKHSPIPNFRDLIRLADDILKANRDSDDDCFDDFCALFEKKFKTSYSSGINDMRHLLKKLTNDTTKSSAQKINLAEDLMQKIAIERQSKIPSLFNQFQRQRSFEAKTWYELCEKKIDLRKGVEFPSLDEVPMKNSSSRCTESQSSANATSL